MNLPITDKERKELKALEKAHNAAVDLAFRLKDKAPGSKAHKAAVAVAYKAQEQLNATRDAITGPREWGDASCGIPDYE